MVDTVNITRNLYVLNMFNYFDVQVFQVFKHL